MKNLEPFWDIFPSVTTDVWTSNSNEGYAAVTLHFIDKEWVLPPILLLVKISIKVVQSDFGLAAYALNNHLLISSQYPSFLHQAKQTAYSIVQRKSTHTLTR